MIAAVAVAAVTARARPPQRREAGEVRLGEVEFLLEYYIARAIVAAALPDGGHELAAGLCPAVAGQSTPKIGAPRQFKLCLIKIVQI